jgi:rhodanese-related sulfurtransferase
VTIHTALILAAALLGGGAAMTGLAGDEATRRDATTAVALAQSIVDGRPPRVFDLRSAADFVAFHIPSASRATLEELAALELPRPTPIVVYADGPAMADRGSTLLQQRGYHHAAFLPGGVYEWIVRVHEPQLPVDATEAEHRDFEHRAALSRFFGGQPHLDVPRAALPAGNWTPKSDLSLREPVATSLLVAAMRRRGC